MDVSGSVRARRGSVRRLAFALAVSLLGLAPSARADEPWLLDLEALGGAPLGAPQKDWYGGGGSLAIGVGKPVTPWLAFEGRYRAGLFLDGDKPKAPNVKDPDVGTLNSLTVGVSLRVPDGTTRRATGPWLATAIGGAVTGKDVRATWEAGLGWGFGLSKGLAIGPELRFVQIIQPNGSFPPSDARILLGGVRLSLFDDARPEAPPPPPPEGDSDGDGIFDSRDQCVSVPEDKDGFEDEDGCPEDDNDRDGLVDAQDRCPIDPEDRDGYEDGDGCPDDDNDKDKIADKDDQCPNEPETLNGERDDDGCPDQGLIEMRDDRIVLEERVLFDTKSYQIKKTGEPILDAIIKLQRQHPEWTKMRIEGHADVRGDAVFNQKLSEQRAESVRNALVKRGLSADMVAAEGFGATRLLSNETSDEGHQKNRRVEFVVTAHVPASGPPPKAPTVPGAAIRLEMSTTNKEHKP